MTLLFPVQLRQKNAAASTNADNFMPSGPGHFGSDRPGALKSPDSLRTDATRMSSSPHLDQIAERVERLLLRHQELQRTNALLAAQVDSLTHERDSLKSRLNAARARVDALLDRLPEASAAQVTVAASVKAGT